MVGNFRECSSIRVVVPASRNWTLCSEQTAKNVSEVSIGFSTVLAHRWEVLVVRILMGWFVVLRHLNWLYHNRLWGISECSEELTTVNLYGHGTGNHKIQFYIIILHFWFHILRQCCRWRLSLLMIILLLLGVCMYAVELHALLIEVSDWLFLFNHFASCTFPLFYVYYYLSVGLSFAKDSLVIVISAFRI